MSYIVYTRSLELSVLTDKNKKKTSNQMLIFHVYKMHERTVEKAAHGHLDCVVNLVFPRAAEIILGLIAY